MEETPSGTDPQSDQRSLLHPYLTECVILDCFPPLPFRSVPTGFRTPCPPWEQNHNSDEIHGELVIMCLPPEMSRKIPRVKACLGEATWPVAGAEGREANEAPAEQPCIINRAPGPAALISRLIKAGCSWLPQHPLCRRASSTSEPQ